MSYGNANFCIPNNFQSFFKLKRVYKEYNFLKNSGKITEKKIPEKIHSGNIPPL